MRAAFIAVIGFCAVLGAGAVLLLLLGGYGIYREKRAHWKGDNVEG